MSYPLKEKDGAYDLVLFNFTGVSLESEDEEEMPPLFQTQFDDSELDRRKTGRRNTKDDKNAGNYL